MLVADLMALKVQYKEKTGTEFVTSGSAPAAAKAAKKEKAAAAAAPAAKAVAKAAAPPKEKKSIPRPVFLTPGPKAATTSKEPATPEVPTASAVLSADGSVDLNLLEARLIVFSYVGGYLPSKIDNT